MITRLGATRYRCFEQLGVDTDAAFAEMHAAFLTWFPLEVAV